MAYRAELSEDEVHPQIWREIHDREEDSPSQEKRVLPVLVWIDEERRLRRISFEGSRTYRPPMWNITEFADYGVPVPQGPLDQDRRNWTPPR